MTPQQLLKAGRVEVNAAPLLILIGAAMTSGRDSSSMDIGDVLDMLLADEDPDNAYH